MIDLDTLRLIAARSRPALQDALAAIKAQQAGTPMAARRASKAAEIALEDPDAVWSPEERTALASLLGGEAPHEIRDTYVRFRASKAEKRQVVEAAKAAGLTQSDYVRQALGLPTIDEA
jgi:hypothetical protein